MTRVVGSAAAACGAGCAVAVGLAATKEAIAKTGPTICRLSTRFYKSFALSILAVQPRAAQLVE